MALFHSKVSRGHRYWYIVESRRVNGKPRPIVLAYLGKADDLLKRLEALGILSTHRNRPQFQGLSVYTTNPS